MINLKKVNLNILMGINMLASWRIWKDMDMANIFIVLEKFIKAYGKITQKNNKNDTIFICLTTIHPFSLISELW
jgi:hypothetical protein